jgi:hypothetical protein
MSTRTAAWLAWSMWTLSIGLTVLSLWLLILNFSHPNIPVYRYWAEDTLLAVGYSTVGAVAASYRPWNPVGWVLCSEHKVAPWCAPDTGVSCRICSLALGRNEGPV